MKEVKFWKFRLRRNTMNILVCIKQVPGSTNVEVDPVTGVLKRDGIQSKMNPYDLYAIETALTLTEKYGGEVYTITMGPPQAKGVIVESICMGAKGGCVLSDRKFAGADVLATAYTLSQGIKKAGNFDMILCGKQTTDGDTAQVGAEVSEFLGLPNVSNVLSVDDVKDGKVYVTTTLDEKVVKLSVKLPCLMSVDGDINSPRLPSYKVKQSVTDDMVKFYSFDDFEDKNVNNYGLNGSATQVERIFPPEKNTEKCSIDGDSKEQSQSLFELIKNRKII
jgi:electron transfer flavoprotein beta subunit